MQLILPCWTIDLITLVHCSKLFENQNQDKLQIPSLHPALWPKAWIRRRFPEPKILGLSPSKVDFCWSLPLAVIQVSYPWGLPLITYAPRGGGGGVNTNAYKCVQGGRGGLDMTKNTHFVCSFIINVTISETFNDWHGG